MTRTDSESAVYNPARKTRIVMVVVVATLLLSGVAFWVRDTWLQEELSGLVETMEAQPVPWLITLFIAWTLMMMTAAPLGSISVALAGFVFGPVAGLTQFASQTASSVLLYSALGQPEGNSVARRIAPHPKLELAARSARWTGNRPVIGTAVIRLIPVVPSCVCVLVCHSLGYRLRGMIVGSMLSGWVRPLAFAWAGSRLPDLAAFVSAYL